MVVRDGALTRSDATDTVADAVDAAREFGWIGTDGRVTLAAQPLIDPQPDAASAAPVGHTSPVALAPYSTLAPVVVVCTCTLDMGGPLGEGWSEGK